MLFVDGCSLLHILKHDDLRKPEPMHIKVDQLVLVMTDTLLLENQLPYLVLKLLWKDDNEDDLKYIMKKFLKCHHFQVHIQKKEEQQHRISIQNESESESPVHLLD
ncbi:DUF247 domain protein, partial [Trifolium medium]|nr:DUF247 domain protein [Trifolium medium]